MITPAASAAPISGEYVTAFPAAENSGAATGLVNFDSYSPHPFGWGVYLSENAPVINLIRESATSPLSGLENLDYRRASSIETPTAAITFPTEFASHTAPLFAKRAQSHTDFADDEIPLLPQARRIIADSAWENFADGMESGLSRKLHSLIQAHGGEAVKAFGALIKNGHADVESAEEILRQIGYSEHAPTHDARLELLVDCLFSPGARVRDAASIGVAGMDDPAALNAVETALANEPTEFIRYSLTLVLEQLRETEKEIEDAKCRDSLE